MSDRVPRRLVVAARVQTWAQAALVVLPLVLMVASDYKVRIRGTDQSVSGAADPFVLLELAVYLTVGGVIFATMPVIRRGRALSLPALAAGLWFGMLLLSATYSPYLSLSAARAAELAVWLLVTLALARWAGRAGLHRLAHGFLVLVAASVVFGKVHPFPSLRLQVGRFTWLYVHPVVAGIYLGIATVVALTYLFGHRVPRPGPRWPRLVYLVLFGLVLYGLIATKTRGAALGAAAAIVLVMLLTVRAHRRRDLIVFGLLGSAGAAVAMGSVILDFLARGESTSQLATLNSRTELWSLAWEQVLLQPIFGHGLAASRGLFLDEIGLGGGHNVIVNVMVDQGFLGLAFFALLIASLALALRRLARVPALRLDVALVAGVLLFLVSDGMTTEYMGAPDNVASGWLLILVAWVYTLHRRRQTGPDRPGRTSDTRHGPDGGGPGGGGPGGGGRGGGGRGPGGDPRPVPVGTGGREQAPADGGRVPAAVGGPRGATWVPGQGLPGPSGPRPAWPAADPDLVPERAPAPIARADQGRGPWEGRPLGRRPHGADLPAADLFGADLFSADRPGARPAQPNQLADSPRDWFARQEPAAGPAASSARDADGWDHTSRNGRAHAPENGGRSASISSPDPLEWLDQGVASTAPPSVDTTTPLRRDRSRRKH